MSKVIEIIDHQNIYISTLMTKNTIKMLRICAAIARKNR